MSCDASSDTEQPHYRSYIYSHFDILGLISMARMQSAPKEESKSLMCRLGIEPLYAQDCTESTKVLVAQWLEHSLGK